MQAAGVTAERGAGRARWWRQGSGTGLGLCMVERLVTLYGGKIDVRIELDVGTTFSVVLPFASA